MKYLKAQPQSGEQEAIFSDASDHTIEKIAIPS